MSRSSRECLKSRLRREPVNGDDFRTLTNGGRSGAYACAGHPGKKEPGPSVGWIRAITWRRPTLTGPIVPLPSAQRRFTSGFGMGPGGSTALWSPEGNIGAGWRMPSNSKTGSLGA